MKFFEWVVDGFKAAFDALFAWLSLIFESMKTFLIDLPLLVFDSIIDAVIAAFQAFSSMLDCCLAGSAGLNVAINAIPAASGVVYYIDRAGIVPALACLGAALTFRLFRKIVTLGHW